MVKARWFTRSMMVGLLIGGMCGAGRGIAFGGSYNSEVAPDQRSLIRGDVAMRTFRQCEASRDALRTLARDDRIEAWST